MRQLRFTIVKNAFANVTKGSATAIVALVLPHFLTRALDHDRFAAWSLMLQIAAYGSYLDFGLQTAVARFVAHYMEGGEGERRDEIVSTALAFLSLAAVFGLALTSIVVWQLSAIFHGVPSSLMPELRGAILVIGGSTALLLPCSGFAGILVGLHRNEYVAVAVGGSRLLGALAVLFTVQHTQSLVALAVCVAVFNVLSGIAQIALVTFLLPSLRLSPLLIGRATGAELGRYCAGLSAWSFSAFLIQGLDVTIVGHFDFKAVGYYAVASTLITFFAGINYALCSALMTPVAALHATGQIDRIPKLILNATRLNTFFNLLAAVITFLFGPYLLPIWVGDSYAHPAWPIIEVLMIANVVRLVANPYASMLIATNQQKHGIAQGAVEALTNFVTSLVCAFYFGAIGVAFGTLIGAIWGIVWTCTLTLKWVKEIPVSRAAFIKEGMLRPFCCAFPLLLFTAIMHNRFFSLNSGLLLALCLIGAYFLTDQFGKVLPSSLRIGKLFVQPG